jgi:hypothetical protein
MVNTELDRGIAMANVAATPQSVFYAQAEEVYVAGEDRAAENQRAEPWPTRPRSKQK